MIHRNTIIQHGLRSLIIERLQCWVILSKRSLNRIHRIFALKGRYLIVRKSEYMPLFDERFINYGYNKQQWVENLQYVGYKFAQFKDTELIFLILCMIFCAGWLNGPLYKVFLYMFVNSFRHSYQNSTKLQRDLLWQVMQYWLLKKPFQNLKK